MKKDSLVAIQIWASLLVSVGIYYVLTTQVAPQGTGNIEPILPKALAALASFQIVGVLFYRYRFLWVPMTESSKPSEVEAKRKPFLPKYLVAWALCESVALYGLVLFFLGDTGYTFHWFFIASAGSLVACFPIELLRNRSA